MALTYVVLREGLTFLESIERMVLCTSHTRNNKLTCGLLNVQLGISLVAEKLFVTI